MSVSRTSIKQSLLIQRRSTKSDAECARGLNQDLFSYIFDFGKWNNVHMFNMIIPLFNKIWFVQNIVYFLWY